MMRSLCHPNIVRLVEVIGEIPAASRCSERKIAPDSWLAVMCQQGSMTLPYRNLFDIFCLQLSKNMRLAWCEVDLNQDCRRQTGVMRCTCREMVERRVGRQVLRCMVM